MRRKKFLTLLPGIFTVLIFITWTVNTDTLPEFHVPSLEYPTIQAGIDAAALVEGGGRVLVAPGTYNALSGEIFPINLPSGVELINAGPGVCVLDAEGWSTVISCTGDSTSRVEGFLIINGGGSAGGGISCYDYSSPVIVNNIIAGNGFYFYGGGIICGYMSFPLIINNTIVGNSGGYFGGGGIYCGSNSYPTIANNIIYKNRAVSTGGGIYCYFGALPIISNNNLNDNSPYLYSGCSEGEGDIFVDPEFVNFEFGTENPDYTTFDYHLQPSSLCIDAGTNEFRETVNFDFEGNPRPLDGDGDEEALVDIGADEFVPPPVARAGLNQTVPAGENGEATVTLDGSDSYDPGKGTLSYEWKDSSGEVIGTNAEVTVTLGLGTYTFTLTVSSISDNGTDEVEITVEDTTSPVPDEVTLPTVEGECLAEVLTIPTATDNCSGALEGETDDLLVYDEKGDYTVTWTYTDESGNITKQEQTVIVRDMAAPVPDVVTLPIVEGECSVEITEAPTATDNCAGTITGTTTKTLPIVFTANGTVIWTYNDGNGNTTTQEQTVIVRDVTAPVPDAETLSTLEGECSVEITEAPTATDNCAGTITGTTTEPLPIVFTANGTVTWTYDDGNGNIATQTQTVKVEDITPPTILLSESTCVDLDKSVSVNMLTISASDNCSSEIELIIDKVEIFDKKGHRVSEKGIYNIVKHKKKKKHHIKGKVIYTVVENDIYVFPKKKDLSICVTATASDEKGNTKTEKLCQPLLNCSKWSEKRARLILQFLQLLMSHCHSW